MTDRELIARGRTIREFLDISNRHNIKDLRAKYMYFELPKTKEPDLCYIWGTNRVKGSEMITNTFDTLNITENDWSRYDAHKAVVLHDNFHGISKHLTYAESLVHILGSVRQFKSEKIVLLSCKPPWETLELEVAEKIEKYVMFNSKPEFFDRDIVIEKLIHNL